MATVGARRLAAIADKRNGSFMNRACRTRSGWK
jgi:hypothetical protein